MKLTKLHIAIIMVAALILGFLGAYGGVLMAHPEDDNGQQQEEQAEVPFETPGEGNGEEPSNEIGKVDQAFQLIKENYLEDVEDQQLIEGAIQGMLTTLEDPYSSYMDVEMMDEFNEQIESSFEGIGAEVSMVNGAVTIVSPIKDSPAEQAGLRPNDQVLTVDDESVEGLDLNEAVAKIRGEKGSEVTLSILRPGSSEPFDITIVRDTIPVETVYSETETIDGKLTGILEVTNFSEQTAEEFTEQLELLENEGMEGLIIDVRGNPGGLLNVVEDILMEFIPEDTPYLQIEDQDGNQEPFYSQLGEGEEKDYPISVIIDEGSASASEILAVALKEMEHDVVGQPSFGKGTVQQAVPMGDGSSIKLTFYKWLSPNGEWIHETGVEPTIEVQQPDYYYTNPVQIDEPLTYDQADERIGSVQLMLEGLGYDPGRTDGYFDDATINAVTAFQEEYDLEATGEIDQDTAGMIEAELIDHIRNGEDDQQLEKAIEEIYE